MTTAPQTVNIHDMALLLFEPFTYQSYPFRLSFDVQGQLHMDHGSNTIQRVLLELMANSCKHAQLEPGDNLEVVLKLEQRGQYAQLIYEDNAAELSAEQAAQILSPFYTTARANGALGHWGLGEPVLPKALPWCLMALLKYRRCARVVCVLVYKCRYRANLVHLIACKQERATKSP
ncbi:ATP-binding protein [Pseudoalteromonas sp. MM17-2]|uniref:ATP-binding protein n=1 Tax=Pseudoalteromonas sp. MM17-2 TaxID=2917753 RepID=UPI001EF43F6A|nr:ATP-binding protein [Pseudoalteromonas sp. MM17-2]MCG7543135.1 ATP-binding protein [Pseudoalteromonas sp. MM17-2]